MDHKIQLSYEGLIALMQGNSIFVLVQRLPNSEEGKRPEYERFVIIPPFDGLFLTWEQIRTIQYNSDKRIFDMIQKIIENSNVEERK